MCTIQKMQRFAIEHDIARPSVLPELLNSLAQRQNMSLDVYLETLDQKPDLGDFVAEVAKLYPQTR